MTYDEAIDEATIISVESALRELRLHGHHNIRIHYEPELSWIQAGTAPFTEMIAKIDKNNNVKSSDILNWLGY